MNKSIVPISLVLRLSLGATFVLSGAYKALPGGVKTTFEEFNLIARYFGNLLAMMSDTIQSLPLIEILYWGGLAEMILGLLLIFGIFTKTIAAVVITWSSLKVIGNPLFWHNPISALFQNSQIIGQIGLAIAVFYIGALSLSFDSFFLTKQQSKKSIFKLEAIISYSLATSFIIGFASIFLFIDEQNYVIFKQWHYITQIVPIFNMPIIGGYLAVSAILLALGYLRISVGFVGSIIFLISMLIFSDTNFELLPLFGGCLALAMLPQRPIRAVKMIPKRRLKDL